MVSPVLHIPEWSTYSREQQKSGIVINIQKYSELSGNKTKQKENEFGRHHGGENGSSGRSILWYDLRFMET